MTLQYTSELPPLSRALIAEWRKAGRDALVRNNKLLTKPSFLGPTPVGDEELRVWRRGMSPALRTAVAHILERITFQASYDLWQGFDYDYIHLNSRGKLQGVSERKPIKLTPSGLVNSLMRKDVDRKQVDIVGRNLFSSLEQILRALPRHTRLRYDGYDKSYYHDASDSREFHTDDKPRLLLNYSETGTPYWDEVPHFRTQGGDVSLHGDCVDHGLATAPRLANGHPRQRFVVGFNVHYMP